MYKTSTIARSWQYDNFAPMTDETNYDAWNSGGNLGPLRLTAHSQTCFSCNWVPLSLGLFLYISQKTLFSECLSFYYP